MRAVQMIGVVLASCLAQASLAAAAPACPAPPPVVRDVEIPRYYDDAAGTHIDPKQKAANEAAVAPLVAFLREVTSLSDAAVRAAKADRREASARCALAWLEAWARGQAWLGRVDQQGEYQRKWDLAGASLAYVKVKRHATREQQELIEAWLTNVGVRARAFFDNPNRKRNNHWYWLGLSLAGVALATGDERAWTEARRIAADAARDIRADGTLQMELDRGERALHYHAFALMPLVVLAEIAALRGEDFYALGGGALHRLAVRVLSGLAEPSAFERITGKRQVLTASSAGAGWLPLYARRFPDRVPPDAPTMKPGDRRLGGDVNALVFVLAREPSR